MEYKYMKYKYKYLIAKNLEMIGGAAKNDDIINEALIYAKTLIGIPYRWWHDNEEIKGDDKFWAANDPTLTADEIKSQDKCIVCTGLINLIRRYVGLSIPGLDGKQGKFGMKFPGTTYTWFRYLKRKKRLIEIDLTKKYPIGTLLIADYKSVDEQGHVAIIIDYKGSNIKEQSILHSYSENSYQDSKHMKNVGETGVEELNNTLLWFKVTHVCLPENWLIKD
jgi:hypothetical protein